MDLDVFMSLPVETRYRSEKAFQERRQLQGTPKVLSGKLLPSLIITNTCFLLFLRKRKIHEIQESRLPCGVEKWKNKGRQTWKRAKQRRK
ncbi:hypothetical protein GW17_00052613 [Ensete ventricosum]|nr:hypothetical protein GW17_00052613 [Ensete ventricosum]